MTFVKNAEAIARAAMSSIDFRQVGRPEPAVAVILPQHENISMKTLFRLLIALNFLMFAQFSKSAQTDADTLTAAAGNGDLAKVESLLARGVKIDTPDYLGWTPLYRTMINGHTKMVQKLLNSGANVNARNRDGETPLFVVADGRIDLAEMLLAKGANINAVNEFGRTPLMWMIQGRQNDDVALWLISKGANINARTKDGETALHVASEFGRKTVVRALLGRKADLNARRTNIIHDQEAPLHIAVDKNNMDIALLLLAAGADINVADGKGITPLIHAIYEKHLPLAEMLINKGADVNRRTKSGETALHPATYRGNLAIVKQLVMKGADVNAEDDGRSPLDAAIQYSKTDIAAFLKSKGAIVETYRCTASQNGGTKTVSRHGPCPSPTDQRVLMPPRATVAVQEAPVVKTTAEEVQPLSEQPRAWVRCTSPDGKSSRKQRGGKCASPTDTQTAVEITKPSLPRSPQNTQIIRCTSPDGRVSIQRGNCESSADTQQLLAR